VELSITTAEGTEVEMLNDLPRTGDGWRLPDLAWGAEAWAVVRVRVPSGALPKVGQRMTVLRVAVKGHSLQGEPVSLERTGLALPVLPAADFDALTEDELVRRRCEEVEAGKLLAQMRGLAEAQDWRAVEAMLAGARERFAGNPWVASILAGMDRIAQSRSQRQMMKEAIYASGKLQIRLSAVREDPSVNDLEVPAYLRRKPLQGKS